MRCWVVEGAVVRIDGREEGEIRRCTTNPT